MRVLVAFATKEGSTAEIARVIGEELVRAGLEAEVLPVRDVQDVRRYDAVLLGSAVYFGQWRKEALAFGRAHARELRERPAWLFDSGPLNDSAESGQSEPVRAADDLREEIGARGRTTFGGKLLPENTGFFMRRVMAGGKAGTFGDHRNLERVRAWARDIASQLAGVPERPTTA